MNSFPILFTYIIIINISAYVMMAVDKKRAKNNAWRIPEKSLWLVAIFGGAIGEWLGMKVFRHKTKHLSFKLLLPLLSGLYIFLFFYLL